MSVSEFATGRPPLSSVLSRAQIGERRRAKSRDRLLSAGAKVLAELGAQKITIEDVIIEAKVSRGTFYNHFETREDLLQALWSTWGHDPFARILEACTEITNPVEHLSAVTRLVLRRALFDPTLGWLVVALSADRATVNSDLLQYPLPDLRAAADEGLLHLDDLICAADMVVGTVRAGLRALLREKRASHYPDSMSKMLLMALGLTRAEAHKISHEALP